VSITAVLGEVTAILMVILALPYLFYFEYIKGKSRAGAHQPPEDKAEKISILICTLNAEDTIERKIGEILNQSYPLENIELILVDGGSTDGTLGILDNLKEAVNQKVLFRAVSSATFASKASQVNEGFRVSRNPFVVTTDADCVVDSNAIPILIGTLSQKGVGAVCSRQILTNPRQNLITHTEATYRTFYQTLRTGESNVHSTPIFHGGLSGYRREAHLPIFEDVNADDTQLALAAIRTGYRALYEPRCFYSTKSPSGLVDGFRQRIRRGQGLQRVFWRNRDMMLSRKFGAFSFPIYAAEFFVHLISPLLFVPIAVLLIALLCSLIALNLALTLPLCILFLFLIYWKKKSAPVIFITSFAYYQIALFSAMILHLAGYNYRRWSRTAGSRLP
jgi:poly-beta-1,6-N-acetyl-D-glucosamine synthase